MRSSRILLATSLLLACNLFGCSKEKTETPEPAPAAEPAPEEGETVAAEKHFDVSKDKSGAIARAAAVLEADGVDNEDLQVMSHHAEALPSAAAVCQHMMEVQGSTGGIKDCVADVEHHVAELGPEIWAEAADCFMSAQTTAELEVCAAAEEEAERLLHDQPHGDGLDEAACTGLFDKFKTLTIAEKKDDAEHIGQVLDFVKDNVVRSCMLHSTHAELDCADASKTLHELEECTKVL